ncbi:hypothetical protein [uncultured Megasphaera sp.]|uniref:hypothetical protein n=1 Tax=uncultured Megasphaera sp. TaxID=165188 RepID=UPI0025997C79|nr:hypothetical protein [uncultured Megasphaera sp.]
MLEITNEDRRMLSDPRMTAAFAAMVGTQTLTCMALHDKFNFGKKRISALSDEVNRHAERISGCGDTFSAYRNKLDAITDPRLKRDYMAWVKKGIGVQGSGKRKISEAGLEYSYVLMLWALHTLYGFGRDRLVRVQKYMKLCAGLMRDNEISIVEFMKCLQLEIHVLFLELEVYEKKYGPIDLGPLRCEPMEVTK